MGTFKIHYMLFYDLEIYKEVVEFSKTLNKRIKQMDAYYRRDVGDEMRKHLRKIRYNIYEINCHTDNEKLPYLDELIKKLVWMKILIDDAIENDALRLTGKKNVIICIKQLKEITSQATKWRKYIRNHLDSK